MDRTFRIGYLSSIAVAPLLVALHKGWFDALGLKVEASLQIGWTALERRLSAGALQGGIVPSTLPIAAAHARSESALSYQACLAMGFGGVSILGAPDLADPPKERPVTTEIRYGSAGTIAGDLHYARRWLRATGRSKWEADLACVPVAATQCSDFLAENMIDFFASCEPWTSIATAAGSGVRLPCGEPFESHDPALVLALSRNWLDLHEAEALKVADVFEAASRWIAEPSHADQLVKILREEKWEIADDELKSLFYPDSSVSTGNARLTFSRPDRAGLRLQKSDAVAAWNAYCLSGEAIDRPAKLAPPEWATGVFKYL